MNIILAGFMGSGKTTIAKVMSKNLDVPYFDIDAYIEDKEGKRISDIFSAEGENYFRNIEKTVVSKLSKEDGIIIATGGGTILDSENTANLKINGKIVFLDVTIDTIILRTTGNSKRPLLESRSKKEIADLLMGRLPIYKSAADIVVDANEKTLNEISNDIIKKLSLDKYKI